MKFNVGDKVRIKTREAMLSEENVIANFSGDLLKKEGGFAFTKYMHRFCGRTAIVISSDEQEGVRLFIDEFGMVDFSFSEWMLEDVDGVITFYVVSE